ncbi:GAP family protein [Leucobacter ruminantium]|uniref:GAP family protein n=2 Tax=Leucobacter ruminantium TaxID=1289170 RepID=A0A939LWF1_9MICO|nr:GAP family protein [Leucobacter ruminantium]MBO1804193.1 GAP family protein [Leucobacter ruminantium]
MDFLTGLPLPAALAILALVDGLSVGTLLIPLFFLIAPGRPRVGRILLYLGSITGFYYLVGILFTLGIVSAIHIGRDFLDSAFGQWALLLVGLALLAAGIWMGERDSRRKKRAKAGDPSAQQGSARLLRWRERVLAPHTSGAAVMGVALAAGLIEVASMLPYLIGMTMIADAPLGMPARFALLAGYCLVMIAPALLLLAARLLAARAVERPLQRFTAWMQRTGAENTSWILGIIGFLLARSAFTELGLRLPFIG